MSTREQRVKYIRANYSLREGAEGGWIATGPSMICGFDRAAVIRLARAKWGHFNFEDEAEAFDEIFPAQLAR